MYTITRFNCFIYEGCQAAREIILTHFRSIFIFISLNFLIKIVKFNAIIHFFLKFLKNLRYSLKNVLIILYLLQYFYNFLQY